MVHFDALYKLVKVQICKLLAYYHSTMIIVYRWSTTLQLVTHARVNNDRMRSSQHLA